MKKNIGLVATLVLGSLAACPALAQSSLGKLEPANQVYGKEVMSSDNQKVGELNNLIVDFESGRILYATVGAAKGTVGVPPQIFTKTPSSTAKNVQANVTKQKIDGAPQFSAYDKEGSLGSAQYVDQVYTYFGQSPWWQGSQPANVGSFHNVHKVNKAIGMTVEDVNNNKIATVNNVIVDLPSGRVAYVILQPDSSLQLGNNLYALPPQALTLSADQKNLVSNIDKAKLASAPHFDKSKWPNLSDPTFASQVYQYYGKQAYFSTGNMAPTGR